MHTGTDDIKSYSFTLRAWKRIGETVDSVTFETMDAEAIYDTLSRRIPGIPFREYLKRYLYVKTEMIEPFPLVPEKTYQDIVTEAFLDTGTPPSFTPGSTRLGQAVRNWLTRDEISRDSVLLLGFGLYMTEDEVNDFLIRALHDRTLDPDDPAEAICAYCYRHGYRFAKYRRLRALYEQMDGRADPELIARDQPADREQSRAVIREDTALLDRLLAARGSGPTAFRQKAADTFLELYDQAGKLLPRESAALSPGTLERVISAGIPRNAQRNLMAETGLPASLAFARKRLTRQRIHRILSGGQEPNRYDILTLLFFVRSAGLENLTDRKEALRRFEGAARETLAPCGFGGLYAADPFDAFLILCILTLDPVGTYSDVMETAYQRSGKAETEE